MQAFAKIIFFDFGKFHSVLIKLVLGECLMKKVSLSFGNLVFPNSESCVTYIVCFSSDGNTVPFKVYGISVRL